MRRFPLDIRLLPPDREIDGLIVPLDNPRRPESFHVPEPDGEGHQIFVFYPHKQ